MSKIVLRDYQKQALTTIYADLKNNQHVLLSAIMGAGKTVMCARLIERLFNESNKKFLILMHKVELVDQFYQTFIQFTDVPALHIGVCSAGRNLRELHQRIIIGTLQTFVNYLNDFNYCDLLVIDEAHRITIDTGSQYDKIINYLKSKNEKMRILGLTATPFRLDHGYIYGNKCKKDKKNLFEKINFQVEYKMLLEQGYLMKLDGVVCADETLKIDLDGVGIQAGEYILSQLGHVMEKEIHIDTAVKAVCDYCMEYQKICVFACTIEHAEALYTAFDKVFHGCATIVHSKLSKTDREQNLKDWKSGNKVIMISVNILIEGFDFKQLDCLVFARPTKSPVLWLQAVGRILRTVEGKIKALLVDLTLNTQTFGTDLDNIKVRIPKNNNIKTGEMEKMCPECGNVVHIACRICGECGYEWTVEQVKKEMAEKLPDMKRIVFGEDNEVAIWIEIDAMECSIHETKEDKKLGRIDYYYAAHYHVSLYLCFSDYYQGYAVEKANEIWTKISDDPFPVDCEDFKYKMRYLKIPNKILIKNNGKFKKIIDFEFSDNNKNNKIDYEKLPF